MNSVSELACVFSSGVLDRFAKDELQKLGVELKDAWAKKQIFRTETEARCSVLNDYHHPTKASKYWQAIREQTAMLDNLVSLSFAYRKNEVELKRAKQNLESSKTDLEKELVQIEVDEKLWNKANMESIGVDRVREIIMWSRIKQELCDGSFDSQDPNTHQKESLYQTLLNRAKSLSPYSNEAEVMNVLGPLKTIEGIERKQSYRKRQKDHKKLRQKDRPES